MEMHGDPTSFTTLLQSKLQRMRQGDQQARDELLTAAGLRLEKLARRMLRGYPQVKRWAETGDVLQNALLRLLRALENVRPETTRDFFNLAAVQIRRELIDLARHYRGPHGIGQHHDSAAGRDPGEQPQAAAPDERQLEAWAEFHLQVEKLPAEEREVFSLIFYHGWKQQEVAELFQVHVRTVRRWWQAGLQRLHEVCKDLPFD